MPKNRRGVPSLSVDQSRSSPYPCSCKNTEQYRSKKLLQSVGDEKEWEETRCPICMEHPHNAVLLQCSSHEKGCRPYMCDTSSRQSNCLDQFRKSFAIPPSTDLTLALPLSGAAYHGGSEEQRQYSPRNWSSATTPSTDLTLGLPLSGAAYHGGSEGQHSPINRRDLRQKLLCPLCRGQINGWIVMKPARRFMDSRPRSCSLENCDFSGTYSELRKHARLEHPSVRPSEADPRRLQDWMTLEHEIDFQDILSVSQLESEENLVDWMTLELDFQDLTGALPTELEVEWDSAMDMDIGLELPFATYETSSQVDSFYELFERSVTVSSGVSGQSHNRELEDERDSIFLETSSPFHSLYETSVSVSSGVNGRSPNRRIVSGSSGVTGQSRTARMRVINNFPGRQLASRVEPGGETEDSNG